MKHQGVCRLTDISNTVGPEVHGCPACPHPPAAGPAVTASANVWVQGQPALRLGDTGIHAACCGPNTWVVVQASAQVIVNGQNLVRIGDKTQHCGAIGQMITGAGSVHDGSPMLEPIQRLQAEKDMQTYVSNIKKPLFQKKSSVISTTPPPAVDAPPRAVPEPFHPSPRIEAFDHSPDRLRADKDRHKLVDND